MDYRSQASILAAEKAKANDAQTSELFRALLTQKLRGEQEALQRQHEANKAAEAMEEQRRHNAALEAISKQNANTQEGYRKDQSQHLSRQDRLEALAKLIGGGTAKPLSVEQERAQVLANEGLATTERLKKDSAENPKTHKAVLVAEEAKKIPLIGGLLESGVTGMAAFFNPKANQIAADRSKVLQNMGYAKSGANVSQDEKREAAKQMPGLTTPKGGEAAMYDTFAAPFKDITKMHERPAGPAYDQQQLLNYVEKGGALPTPKAPTPKVGLTPEQEARRQELLRKAGQ